MLAMENKIEGGEDKRGVGYVMIDYVYFKTVQNAWCRAEAGTTTDNEQGLGAQNFITNANEPQAKNPWGCQP